ncbi:2204_t:CDS:2 [Racocetra persica]|uniref:2204_t:CDS:1 n=1 Tax=Racocetra persica TaxID=160502 RepID=A0ACA9NCK9_9GLOM|nr:2204_t:CDS:2 [Racocetra persica]
MGNDVIIYYIRSQEVSLNTNSTQSGISQQWIMIKPESMWSSLDLQLNVAACYLSAISISFITVDLPQLISSFLSFLIFLLGLRTQSGISKLIQTPTRNISQNQGKLKHFQDLNIWLTMSLFLWSISYLLLVIDRLFVPQSRQFFGNSRFLTDFLSITANFGRLFVYISLISIIYPDFPIDVSSAPKRQISKPMNVIKHDTPNLDELIYQCHAFVDLPTTSEKQSSSKLSKKNSKSKSPFSKSPPNDDDLPTSPLNQTSLIDDALHQQIVVEMTRERTVEPAYMHAYINPHVSHRNNLKSPTPSDRPFSLNSDLLAPLPSPNSDFAADNKIRGNNNQGRSLFFQNNNQKIAPDNEEIVNGAPSNQSHMNRTNRYAKDQNFVSINVVEQNNLGNVKQNNLGNVKQNNLGNVKQNNLGDIKQNNIENVKQNNLGNVKGDQYNQKDRTDVNNVVIDTDIRNNIGKQNNNNEFLSPPKIEKKHKKGIVQNSS